MIDSKIIMIIQCIITNITFQISQINQNETEQSSFIPIHINTCVKYHCCSVTSNLILIFGML
jgi:hypothetical protein